MTPATLMVVSGVSLIAFLGILFANFLRIAKNPEKMQDGWPMVVHAGSGMLATISAVVLGAGFIWKMVLLVLEAQ